MGAEKFNLVSRRYLFILFGLHISTCSVSSIFYNVFLNNYVKLLETEPQNKDWTYKLEGLHSPLVLRQSLTPTCKAVTSLINFCSCKKTYAPLYVNPSTKLEWLSLEAGGGESVKYLVWI